jgi:hypothetical protein
MKVNFGWLKQNVDFHRQDLRLTVVTLCFAYLLTGCKTPTHPAAPELKTRNVILITTDGLRWQEVFAGAQEALLDDPSLTTNPERMKLLFWKPTPEERRKYLMPFLWSEIAARGQIYGNQLKGSESRVTNGKNFSYPGYNEMLTGASDPRIDSNEPVLNPNTNVFEWLNRQSAYRGKVAAIVNWRVIPWILNAPRSQFPVWSGYALPHGSQEVKSPQLLDDLLLDMTPVFSGIVFDAFILHVALDYLEQYHPRALYVAFNETDEWAHKGSYDRYLIAAKRVDLFISDLWTACQSIPQYRDKTTFIITTDHGRGSGVEGWKNHGASISGSEDTWMAVIGPDTPPLGERENCAPVTASQIAATVAAFLGEDFQAANPHAASPITEARNLSVAPKQLLTHESQP